MSKEVIKLSVLNEDERKMMFKECFLVALRNDQVTSKNGKLYMEVDEKIYSVDFAKFSFVWNPSFEYIFKNDIPYLMKKEKINSNSIRNIYIWSNPIFDEFPVPVQGKNECFANFEKTIASDKEYYDIVRTATFEQIESLSVEKRKNYIDRFISFGVLREEDKIPLQYYAMLSPEMLEKLFEEKNFSDKDKTEIISQAFVQERAKQQKISYKKGKKITNNRIVHLVNLLSTPEILDIFLSGILTNEELSKTRVTKKDLLTMPYEALLEILSDKNDLLPKNLKITSRDLLNEYGRTRNGNEIFKLAKYGYIDPQDLIEVYEINKVLRNTGYDEPIFEDDKLRDYYTPELLVQMNRDNKISSKFIQEYLELFDFENNPELFRIRSQALFTELERRDNNNIEDNVLYFLDNGLCDRESAKLYVSEKYIENKYVNKEISIEKLIEYYHLGLINDTAIAKYYSYQEIIELYKNGTLSGKCLSVISDTDLLMEEFIENKIADGDFIMLYLNGNLSVTDLSDAIQMSEKEIDISSFIDENVSIGKIKELFLNYLIDYASLLRLHNQDIIDDKEFEDIKESLNTQEFFQELRKGKKYKVETSRESPSNPKGYIEPRKDKDREKDEDKFSAEILLISKLLGKDVESEPYSVIESYNSKGRVTSLNNYRIFGNEDLDGIIILQKSKKENSVYVMSALQMMYFLNGKENDDGDIEIQNRMKDKAYLKTIEGVEVVDHTEYFARNLVEAVSRVSPKIAERLKTSDREYISEVEKMVTDMRRTYRDSKQKGRDKE